LRHQTLNSATEREALEVTRWTLDST